MKTKIRFDINNRYFIIKFDSLNWALFENHVIEKGDKAGEVKEERVFYYSTLPEALFDTTRVIADEKAAMAVAEYIDNLKEAEAEIMDAFKKQCKQAGYK